MVWIVVLGALILAGAALLAGGAQRAIVFPAMRAMSWNPAEAGWRHRFGMQWSGAASNHSAKSRLRQTQKRRRRFALAPQSKPGLRSIVIAE